MSGLATMHLYEISDELQAIGFELVENGGELTPELEEAWEALEGAFEAKVERTIHVYRQLAAQAEAARAEADRLRSLASSREKAADRLKDYLLLQMQRVGVEKLDLDTAKVWRQPNGRPSITYEGDLESVPPAFRAVKVRSTKVTGADVDALLAVLEAMPALADRVEVEADTQAAYEAWKADAELPEGFRVERGEHLRIR